MQHAQLPNDEVLEAPPAPAEDALDLYVVWTRRIREGDRSAFESLFRALHPGLVRFAVSLCRDESVAADLVQDAFVRIWQNRESLDERRSVKSLMFTTVRNLSLNSIRDATTRRELLDRGPVPLPTRQDTETRVRENEFQARIDGWIEELSPRQREALRLTRFEGLDHSEAADVMGCSPRTVNNHLVAALRTLRDRVAEHAPELMTR
jgi:RNA polymerase sigma-70 factor (ECF subfamily)